MRWWDNFDIASNQYCSDKPMPLRPRGDGPDFTGKIRGSVRILGYFGEISGRHYWVSKCECDTFSLLSEKTLRNKPACPQHKCPVCMVLEKKRYNDECAELAEAHGIDFETIHREYKEQKISTGASKHGSFGLIHFIRKAIKQKSASPA